MTNDIPGVDAERRIFNRESVRHVLNREWKTVSHLIAEIMPDYKEYEYYTMNSKIRDYLVTELKYGNVERKDGLFVSKRGINMPAYRSTGNRY